MLLEASHCHQEVRQEQRTALLAMLRPPPPPALHARQSALRTHKMALQLSQAGQRSVHKTCGRQPELERQEAPEGSLIAAQCCVPHRECYWLQRTTALTYKFWVRHAESFYIHAGCTLWRAAHSIAPGQLQPDEPWCRRCSMSSSAFIASSRSTRSKSFLISSISISQSCSSWEMPGGGGRTKASGSAHVWQCTLF